MWQIINTKVLFDQVKFKNAYLDLKYLNIPFDLQIFKIQILKLEMAWITDMKILWGRVKSLLITSISALDPLVLNYFREEGGNLGDEEIWDYQNSSHYPTFLTA